MTLASTCWPFSTCIGCANVLNVIVENPWPPRGIVQSHYPLGMADYPLTGGCLCGGVRYEVTEPPLSAGYCHCTRCQRRTGTAASAQARLAPGSLRITHGEELVKAYAPPDGFPKCFCSNCGGALWSRDPDTGQVMSVRLGTLDPGHHIRPMFRTFVDYAAAWEPIPEDGLERYPEGRQR